MTRTLQNAFSGGIMAEGLYARADTEKYQKGLKDGLNVQIRPQGGVFNRAGLELTTGFDTGTNDAAQYLIPFTFSTEQTYQLEFAEDVFRVIKDGAYILDGAVVPAGVDAVTAANPAEITLSDAGDAVDYPIGALVYFQDPLGTHKLHQQVLKVAAVAGADITFEVYDRTTLDTTAGAWGAVGAGATISLVYSQSHPYALADMGAVRFAQDADTMYLTHRNYPVHKIGRVAEDDWLSQPVDFGIGITGLVVGVAAAATVGTGATDYVYKVSPLNDIDEEGLPSASATVANDLLILGNKNTVSWTAFVGATRYNVYREDAGGFGYIGTTTGTSFVDQNITPDISRGPIIDRDPFAAAGDYPGIVSFFEQRLLFGSTLNDPQLVEASRVDSIENFSSAYPSLPDDAFRFRVRAKQVNKLLSFIPHEAFTIMTSAAEWELAGQGDGEYLRPDRRRLSPVSYYGSYDIEPVLVGQVALYVEPSGNAVRDYRLGDRQTPPGDITILCRDLFEGRAIVSWAYAPAPDHVVWVVLDDGSLLSLSYITEHDVWGWTRHVIGGDQTFVRQVSVIKEGSVDTPYFVVQRLVNGRVVRQVERQRPREDRDVKRCYFVDGGRHVSFDGPVGEIGGMLHLRGQTVTALIDGDVLAELTVDATGTVDFGAKTGSFVSVGLPYVARIETLGVQLDLRGLGSSEGRYKAVSEVAIRYEKSRGLEAGTTLARMNAMKEWNASLFDSPIPLRTGIEKIGVEGDWVDEATVIVQQVNPLPMTINSIAPETEFGE